MQNTQFDEEVDKHSINPGQQLFEKRVSGMFLSEIFRHVLRTLIKSANLFNGKSSHVLDKQYGIDISEMLTITSDSTPNLTRVHETIVSTLGVPECDLEDCQAVKLVSGAIVRRSARLAAVTVCAVADHTGRFAQATPEKPVDVGADGSLVQLYPNYIDMCLAACDEILGEGSSKRIRIGLAKDGSGVGAAL